MRQQYRSGENERGQTSYPPFYNENFTYPQDSIPSLFEQKLSSEKHLLMKKYRSSRLFSLVVLILLTIILILLAFAAANLGFTIGTISLLAILYFFAIKLYITLK
jgi:hypothetical protein